MKYPLVISVLGWILIAFALAMVPALGVAYLYQDDGQLALVLSIGVTGFFGFMMQQAPQTQTREGELSAREGFLIVTGGWMLCSFFGALPFILARMFLPDVETPSLMSSLESITNSVFESTSGLTTTGASVLTDYDQPHSLMFWRSTTHWLGGMGIIVLSLAILPLIGAGGMQLFKAEAPGPIKDRLKPRITDTAKTLSAVYVLLTALQVVALWMCGMSLFDAICHSFATLATGGFSTHPGSVGGYENSAYTYVISFFMIVAGINFALQYRLLTGNGASVRHNTELWVYLGILFMATLVFTGVAVLNENSDSWAHAFEHALFQSASILTTTGFATVDYEQWHPFAIMAIFLMMFVGGCAGSTAGGIKVIRIILLTKIAYREMYRLLYPTAVVMVKLDGKTVPDKVLNGISGFFILASAIFIVSVLFLSAFGLDYATAMTATAACLFNIGPGFGSVGPYDNYAHLPLLVKWWLSFMMIVGRLELYSVLILTAPDFWRR